MSTCQMTAGSCATSSTSASARRRRSHTPCGTGPPSQSQPQQQPSLVRVMPLSTAQGPESVGQWVARRQRACTAHGLISTAELVCRLLMSNSTLRGRLCVAAERRQSPVCDLGEALC